MPPKVSIIVLNWNQPELTVNCVKSVLEQGYADYEILLVDNASKDNSVKIFRKEFSGNEKVRFIENSENLGYAGGNNEGVKKASGEYILILNNDTIVEKDWLKELVKGLENEKNIGAVSSTTKSKEERNEYYSTYRSTNNLLGYPIVFKYKKSLSEIDFVDFFQVKGFSFIYRKKAVDFPFDPDYFIYAEDTYFGWLLRLKGYENKTATKSVLQHLHNVAKKSSKKVNKHFIFLGERNRIMNLLIFYEMKNLIRILPLAFIGVVLLNLSEPKKIPYRLKSYFWFLFNTEKILKKRREIQKQRKVPDEVIIREMSCKFFDENKTKKGIFNEFLKIVNVSFFVYCRIVNLKTLEIENC